MSNNRSLSFVFQLLLLSALDDGLWSMSLYLELTHLLFLNFPPKSSTVKRERLRRKREYIRFLDHLFSSFTSWNMIMDYGYKNGIGQFYSENEIK